MGSYFIQPQRTIMNFFFFFFPVKARKVYKEYRVLNCHSQVTIETLAPLHFVKTIQLWKAKGFILFCAHLKLIIQQGYLCISFNIFFNQEYFSLGLGHSPGHRELSDVSLVQRNGKGTALKKANFNFIP